MTKPKKQYIFSVNELIKRVKKQDEIGKKIVKVQLNYLRSLGKLPIKKPK